MIIEKDPSIRGVVRIAGDMDGPRALFFSGIHGNEVSGVHAIEKLLFDFFGGARVLKRGTLTLVRANEEALAAEQRYLKLNMNRLFRDGYGEGVDRTCYEFLRSQQLKPLLETCDYFLDFHSAPSAQEPFLVAERKAVDFYRRLGIGQIITGWSKFSAGSIGGDAGNFAGSHGAVAATLESGSHFDKSAIDVSYSTAIAMLQLLDMIELTPAEVGHQADHRRHVCRGDQGLRGLSLRGRGHQFPAYQERHDLCLPEWAAIDRDRRQLPAHPDETRGHQDRRRGVLSGPQDR